MNRFRHNKNSETGVALLFALGILSLLLVLGLGFVTHALLARKVAFNNNSRTQAKMLAQSAISRVALSVMRFQHQTQLDTSTWPTEFTNIYSYDKNDNKTHDDQLQYPTTQQNERFSKLNYFNNVLDYNGYKNNHAKWVFLYDKDDSTSHKIIGRIAYQVLPSTTSSRLNMQHVLGGYDSAWDHRLGKDVNELYIDATEVFTNPRDTSKHWSYVAPTRLDVIPAEYDTLRSAYSQDFFWDTETDKAEDDDGDRISWVKRWLVEGDKPSVFEAFEVKEGSKVKKYNRFNLSSDLSSAAENSADEWYWRFWQQDSTQTWAMWLNNNSNNENAVNNLAQEATVFKEVAKYSPYNSGLPFLKQIGSDKGSFDSIEAFRKQIAANFNDYCDTDAIPTSDVSATAWMALATKDSTGTLPSYTGNEKDFYINEVAVTFEATPTLTNSTVAPFQSSAIQPQLTIAPHLLVELIDIYDVTNNALKFQTALKSMDFEFKVTIDGELKYMDTSVNPPLEKTITLTNATLDTPPVLNVPAQDFLLDFATTDLKNNGYRAKSMVFPTTPQLELKVDFAPKFLTEWNNIATGKTFKSAHITKINFEITKLNYQFGPMALSRMIKPVDAATEVETGIDFVKFPTTSIPSDTSPLSLKLFPGTANPDADGVFTFTSGSTAFPTLTAKQKTFVLGGMEVYDPRQNLNAKYTETLPNNDALTSDWYLKPTLTSFADKDNAITMDIPDLGGDPDIPDFSALTGKVNSQSNPAVPNKMDGASFDKESTADPAWRGSAKNQHLSTAFIRNAPMKSPWEIGAIHRAQAWRTLNLKVAERPGGGDMRPEDFSNSDSWGGSGTSYDEGDGALLEQIKMTPRTRCFGELDVNMLIDNPDYADDSTAPKDGDMVKALFTNLALGNQLINIDTIPTAGDASRITNVSDTIANHVKNAKNGDNSKFQNRVQFLNYPRSGSNAGLPEGFGLITSTDYNALNDADQEEIVGKTINLLGAKGSELPSTVQVLIVAQSIRDIGTASGLSITKILPNGKTDTRNCKLGQFDYIALEDLSSEQKKDLDLKSSPDQWLYYDEITGEVKLLVTLDRDPSENSGRLVVRKIEYLE